MNHGETAHEGAVIDGRYELVAQLGEGTFGSVWSAADLRLARRRVAIKFLKAEFLSHAEAVSRFEAEADALAQVHHANVVAVLDRGRWGATHFLVTEFVEGHSLTHWLDARRARSELPAVDEALSLFDAVCAGIAAAHSVRAPGAIVHRDIKPDNVLVRRDADGGLSVKIVDFGIAQLGQRGGTRTGALMGTPLYMAPEQALGNTAAVGTWTDVFSLGVVLAEMLTLRAQVDESEPWWGTAMRRGGELRALLGAMRRDVPASVWDVVASALRMTTSERPSDGAALRALLRSTRAAHPPVHGATALAPTMAVPAAALVHGAEHPPTRPLDASATPRIAPIASTLLSLPPTVVASTGSLRPHIAPGGVAPGRSSVTTVVAVAALAVGGAGAIAWFLRAGASPDAARTTVSSPTSSAVAAVPSARAVVQPEVSPHIVATSPVLGGFFARWSDAVLADRAAGPLDAFYVGRVKFRHSGGLATSADIARYFSLAFAHGDTFAIDWARSTWAEEPADSPDAVRACQVAPGAVGPVLKVRALGVEIVPNRSAVTGGEVPCERLEGVYLFRLRMVGGAPRICHETWSLREGVCASCPAARACGTTTSGVEASSCVYSSHSVFHLREQPVVTRDGAEEIATNPRVEVIRAAGVRRGVEALYYVRFLDGTAREGWMFIPVAELGAGCPPG